MQALERTVKVTDVYLARLSIYVEKDVSGLAGTGGVTGGGRKERVSCRRFWVCSKVEERKEQGL